MAIKQITEDVLYVGAPHPDRKLFDALIPLPDGTSYNSYVVKGSEKIALIDTVDPEKFSVLKKNLEETKVKIDYIVANHAEQDHSGSLPKVLEMFPDAKILTNQTCKNLLMDHLNIPEDKFQVVSDKEKISLGNKTLEFVLTPWVHWPETMCTYLVEDMILFSCDFFGAHSADKEIFVKDEEKVTKAAKRYYAEIMMPFRSAIKGNLAKLEPFIIKMIAPSHGQVYKNPRFIMDAYADWISDTPKNLVTIAYVSMHDSTKLAVEHLEKSLKEKNIPYKTFNLTEADLGELAMSLVDAATAIIASPAVLTSSHPTVTYGAHLINLFRPKLKQLGIIDVYGWGSNNEQNIKNAFTMLNAEMLETVKIKGIPKQSDKDNLTKLANTIAEKHSGL
jgi:flavorubredoxin